MKLVASRTGLVGLCLLLAGCRGADDRSPSERTVDTPIDTIVSTSSGLLASVAGLAVHGDGRLFVSDALNHAIQVFGTDGSYLQTIGHQGEGPGEFVMPLGLRVEGDSLVVVDSRNRRNQILTTDGDYLGSQPWLGVYAPALGPDGAMVHPTLGIDSSLAVMRGPRGEEPVYIGTPLAEVVRTVSMSGMHEQILNGEIPPIFLNSATPLVDEEGAVWLLIPAAERVERYSADGARLWSTTLDEPEFRHARTDFVERNRAAEPDRVFGLEYLRSAQVMPDGLWILLASSEEVAAAVVVMSSEGEVVEKIRFPGLHGASLFAVDELREVAYFFLEDRAALVRTSLR